MKIVSHSNLGSKGNHLHTQWVLADGTTVITRCEYIHPTPQQRFNSEIKQLIKYGVSLHDVEAYAQSL